jgi:predicted regulator of Ras-like GTPase activity (Roadblock/LC7/MglB family)
MAKRKQESTSRDTSSQGDQLSVKEALGELMQIDGAVGATIVDYESGMTLGTDGGRNLDMELAGAGTTEVVRSKKNIIHDLGLDEKIQDILISLNSQYHLVRMCERHDDIFIYVVIDRDQGNLGLARRKIDDIDQRLELQ